MMTERTFTLKEILVADVRSGTPKEYSYSLMFWLGVSREELDELVKGLRADEGAGE